MDRIPLEIQDKFLEYLDCQSLLNCRLTRKDWNTLVCKNHLKNCHPPIKLWSEEADDMRTVARLVDLMETSIQEFPFSNVQLYFSPSWFLGSYLQNTDRMIKFATNVGKFVKRLAIFPGDFGEEMKYDCVDSTLAMFSCIEYLDMGIDLPFTEVKLSNPLSHLKEIRLRNCDMDEHLPLLANLIENTPNLKKLSLETDYWSGDKILDTLMIIRHVPTLDLHFPEFNECVNKVSVSADLLRHMISMPLKIRKLSLGGLCPWEEDLLSVLPQWLSILSSTLEILSLGFESSVPDDGHPHSQHLFEIPYLGKLKELKLGESNVCTECIRSSFGQLFPGKIPVLTKMSLHESSFQLLSGSVFPQVSHVELCDWNAPLPPRLDITFPNLEWLSLDWNQEERLAALNLIFSRLKNLKHLQTNVYLSLLWIFCGKYRRMEIPSEDTWLLESMKDVEAPPKIPGSPSNIRDSSLISLSLSNDERCLDEFMRGLTYLSSTKMLPGLNSLVVESYTSSKAEKKAKLVVVEKWLPRLMDCHQNVDIRIRGSKYSK